MKERSISKELKTRKYKTPSKLVSFLYKVIMYDICCKKYHINNHIIDDVNDCKGPCFVIFNHLSRIDHAYILGCTYPRRTNMICEYNEFFRKRFSFIFKLNNIIPKKNYIPDISTIKNISKIVKQDGCVLIAPEGLASNYGTNKPVVPGTGKLFKHFNIPVYMCYLEGNYLQNTKYCLEEKYGETHATMSLLFKPEDLEKLSVEEIDDIINTKFHRNEFEWSKNKHIYWKVKNNNMAYQYEHFMYKCPKCHKEFSMVSEGNKLYCKECGNGTIMNNYYEFEPFNKDCIIPVDPVKWVEQERMDIIDEIRKDKDYYFEDDVEIGNLDDHKLIKKPMQTAFMVGKGKLRIDHNGVHYVGTRNNEPYEFHLDYNHIYTTITVMDSSFFSFYVNEEYFEIHPLNKTQGKMMLLIEEMHRYHINFYKNFKWYDYMYEGKELGIDNKK